MGWLRAEPDVPRLPDGADRDSRLYGRLSDQPSLKIILRMQTLCCACEAYTYRLLVFQEAGAIRISVKKQVCRSHEFHCFLQLIYHPVPDPTVYTVDS